METKELEALIAKCLQDFYKHRLDKLEKLKLKTFLKRKNPYLFRAMGMQKASDIIERVLESFISSSDETIFGTVFFEPIAVIVSGGKVSDGEGVDFTVESERKVIAVALKSGPNIFNASQKKRQSQEFSELRNRLYKLQKQFDPILGHAYGSLKSEPTNERIYRDLSGQTFWKEITGDDTFYLKLITLMKDVPLKHKEEYATLWSAAVNRFSKEFIIDFCFEDGTVDWEKLVKFVSQEKTKVKNKAK
jgi:Type II restriction endonuclease EcoO109I